VIQYNIFTPKSITYKFEFDVQNFDAGLQAVLEDKYLNTSTPLVSGNTTSILFDANPSITASFTDRFKIVFKPINTVPVRIVSINAKQKNKSIEVYWKVAAENGIKQYEIERSQNGTNFIKAGAVPATANNGRSANYSFEDVAPIEGTNYYRIKTTDISGTAKYSAVLKTTFGKLTAGITVLSTLSLDNKIDIRLDNQEKGVYRVILTNVLGQKIINPGFEQIENNGTQTIITPSMIKGTYILEIIKPDGKTITEKIVKN
jgi:hypothetical protein